MKQNWLHHLFNFLAVILGVILAFSFNERSHKTHQAEEAALLMQSLSAEMRHDIEIYDQFQIPANREHQENIAALISLLSQSEIEGAEEQLLSIISLENYQASTTIYSSMKSSGKLSLIEDPHLRSALTDYYEGSVLESNAKTDFQNNYFSEELLTWLTDNMDFLNNRILHPEALVLLRNRLMIYESLMEQKIESYQDLSEQCKTLVEAIEAHYPRPASATD